MDRVRLQSGERVDIPDLNATTSLTRDHLGRVMSRLLGSHSLMPDGDAVQVSTGTLRRPVFFGKFGLAHVSGLNVLFTRTSSADGIDALVWDRDGVFFASPASAATRTVAASASPGTYYACVKRGGTYPTDNGVAGTSGNRVFWDVPTQAWTTSSISTRWIADWEASIRSTDPTSDQPTADLGWIRIGTVTVSGGAVTAVALDSNGFFDARAYFDAPASRTLAQIATMKDAFDALTDCLADLKAPNSATDAKKWGVRLADALDDATLTGASGYAKPLSIRSAASRARGAGSVTVGPTAEEGDFTSIASAVAKVTTLGSGTGGRVYLKPGTYSISSALTVPPNVEIIGAGPALSSITWSGSAGATIVTLQQNATSGARLSGLTVYDGGVAMTAGVSIEATASSITGRGVLVDDCYIRCATSTNGISISGTNTPERIGIERTLIRAAGTGILGASGAIQRSRFADLEIIAPSGISLSPSTTTLLEFVSVRVYGTYASGSVGISVTPGSSQNSTRIRGCLVQGVQKGYELTLCVNGQVDDCYATDLSSVNTTDVYGLRATLTANATGLVVRGFYASELGSSSITHTNVYGVHVLAGGTPLASTACVLEGVTVTSLKPKLTGGTRTWGILVGGVEHVTISNPRVVNTASLYQSNADAAVGIFVYDCAHATITSPTIRYFGEGAAAIEVGNDLVSATGTLAHGVVISDPLIANSSGVGIYLTKETTNFAITGGYVQADANEAIRIDPDGSTLGPGLISGVTLAPGATAGVHFVAAASSVSVKGCFNPAATYPNVGGTLGSTVTLDRRELTFHVKAAADADVTSGDIVADAAENDGAETSIATVIGPLPYAALVGAHAFHLSAQFNGTGLDTTNDEIGVRVKIEKLARLDGAASDVLATTNETASPYRDKSGWQNLFSVRRQASGSAYGEFGVDVTTATPAVIISRERNPDTQPTAVAVGDMLRVTLQPYAFSAGGAPVQSILTNATVTVKMDVINQDIRS